MLIHGLKHGNDSKYDLNRNKMRFLPSNSKMDTYANYFQMESMALTK